MYERILLVCTGNICRSPLAEAMLRLQIAAAGRSDVAQVRSAGTQAKLGKRVDDTVLFVARSHPELTPSLSNHRSQPIDSTLTWWADLILVMEPHHGQAVVKLDSTARHKVHLLASGIGKLIPDPYLRHEAVYREVQDLISAAVTTWHPKING